MAKETLPASSLPAMTKAELFEWLNTCPESNWHWVGEHIPTGDEDGQIKIMFVLPNNEEASDA